jgi:hypothetical protein
VSYTAVTAGEIEGRRWRFVQWAGALGGLVMGSGADMLVDTEPMEPYAYQALHSRIHPTYATHKMCLPAEKRRGGDFGLWQIVLCSTREGTTPSGASLTDGLETTQWAANAPCPPLLRARRIYPCQWGLPWAAP